MSIIGLQVFDDTLHKTNSWLKEIAQSFGPDRRAAYRALCAVFKTFTVDEAVHLGTSCKCSSAESNDGLHLAGKLDRVRSRKEFLQRINVACTLHQSALKTPRMRFLRVLVQHRAPGEIRRVVSELSRDIRALCNQPLLQCWNPRDCAYALARNIVPREKNLPALRAPFSAGSKEPQQLPTWHGRRRPIIRPKADCS